MVSDLASRRAVLLVNTQLNPEIPEHRAFTEKYRVIQYTLTTREQLIADLADSLKQIEAIVLYWDAFFPVGGLDQELLNAIPESVKVVTLPSVGHEHVNGALLRTRGISLCNTQAISGQAVADLALFLTLACFRFTNIFEHSLRSCGNSAHARKDALAFDPETGVPTKDSNKSLDYSVYAFGEHVGNNIPVQSPHGHKAAIIGFGAIGQEIGKRLACLGMEIHYYKRTALSQVKANELGYEAHYHSTLESIFPVAELLVLALPLTPQTKHMVNASSIETLPNGSRIVNVGRGPLIDQKALVDALKSKKVLSAGLDVYEKEPIVEQELLQRQDVTLLPHIGGSTLDVAEDSTTNCLANVDLLLSGQQTPHVVN